MPAARTMKLFVLLALAASPATAETDPAAVRSSLEQMLSIATFGAVVVQDQGAEVTRSGADYRMRLPLAGFSAPPDAAINAIAHLPEAGADHGLVSITSMTFPPTGTVEAAMAGGQPVQISYSIGQQAIKARLDPRLAVPSPYEADLRQVRLSSDQDGQHVEQVFDHYTMSGTVSLDADDLLTFGSQGSGTGFRLTERGPDRLATDLAIRALAGHFSVEGLNRAQATRLLAASRGMAAVGADATQPPGVAPDQHLALLGIVEAIGSLLTRFDAEQTLEDVRFKTSAGNTATEGSIGQVRLNLSGEAVDQRLNTRFGVTLDGISSASALSADNAAFVPHHIDFRTVLAGLKTGPLMALLHAAAEQGMDVSVLQGQAVALLSDPQARIAIEAFSFDSGPLQIKGSANFVPRADGQLGAEIHIAARGMAKLLAQAPSQPNLQHVLPMMLMAKGMGRPEGDSLVWDISLGGGPMTVNGLPFGHPAGKTR